MSDPGGWQAEADRLLDVLGSPAARDLIADALIDAYSRGVRDVVRLRARAAAVTDPTERNRP